MEPRAGMAAGLAVVAVAAVALAWLQDVPELSAADAVTATQAALGDAGLDAEVASEPLLTTHTSRARAPVAVWEVHATVRSEPIALQLALAGAHPVRIDDRNTDRSAYVLTEAEYTVVATHVEDPARAREVRRNAWLTAAAALVLALAAVHAKLASQPKEARR